MQISDNLKLIRKKYNLSPSDLAKKINIPVIKIDKYETNASEMSIEDLIKYSKYFNVSLDSLCLNDVKDTDSKQKQIVNLFEKYEIYDKNMIIAFLKLTILTQNYSKEQFNIFICLYKTVLKYKFTELQIHGLIEMLDYYKFSNDFIFTNTELKQLLELLLELLFCQNKLRKERVN